MASPQPALSSPVTVISSDDDGYDDDDDDDGQSCRDKGWQKMFLVL